MVHFRPLVSLDGGGVLADAPLIRDFSDKPVRLRIHLTDDPTQDLAAWIEGGILHIDGHYAPVEVERYDANSIGIRTKEVGNGGNGASPEAAGREDAP